MATNKKSMSTSTRIILGCSLLLIGFLWALYDAKKGEEQARENQPVYYTNTKSYESYVDDAMRQVNNYCRTHVDC